MVEITQEITLDVDKQETFKFIFAKQGDANSRKVKITLMKNGSKIIAESSSETAYFRAKKPDNTSVYNKAEINDDGTITIALTQQTLAVKGIVDADVSIKSENGEILSSASFKIEVCEAPLGDNIPSSNEFLVLQDLIETANSTVEEITQMKNNGDFKGDTGPQGPQGEQGPQGPAGANGAPGKDGAAATVAVGTVTTGEPDTPASVTNSGTANAAVLDFVIPKGEKGESAPQIRTPLSLAEYSSKANPLNVFSLADGAYEITEKGWIGNGLTSRATVELFKGSIFIKYNNAINILSDISYWVADDDERWSQLYLPTILEVDNKLVKKRDKTAIVTPSDINVTLNSNTEYRIQAIANLNLTLPSTIPDDYECSLVFESGETATVLSYPADSIKFVGDDCDAEGDFIPVANTGYEINIKNLGFNRIIARVGAF